MTGEVYTHEYRCPWRPENGTGSPDNGVTSGCKPPNMDTGN